MHLVLSVRDEPAVHGHISSRVQKNKLKFKNILSQVTGKDEVLDPRTSFLRRRLVFVFYEFQIEIEFWEGSFMLNLIVNDTKQRFIESQRNPQRVSFLHRFSPFRWIWFLSEYQGKCKKMAPERDIGIKNKYQYPSLFFTCKTFDIWSKRLVRLVQDLFRIGSDLN